MAQITNRPLPLAGLSDPLSDALAALPESPGPCWACVPSASLGTTGAGVHRGAATAGSEAGPDSPGMGKGSPTSSDGRGAGADGTGGREGGGGGRSSGTSKRSVARLGAVLGVAAAGDGAGSSNGIGGAGVLRTDAPV